MDEDYAGCCCYCRFFQKAYMHFDVDNPGWCVRYPPVFVGGEQDKEEDVDFDRFKQPGVVGGDMCGEFIQATPNAS